MTYRINKTDGTVLTDVINGTIDQVTTDITLIGSDVSGYGELINENFIKILENFSNSELPPYPITGQLWYDTSEQLMKVYDGSQFVKVAGAITTNDNTSVISKPGDIIVDTEKKQVFINTGAGQSLIGPSYSSDQGISGIQNASIKQGTTSETVTQIWNSNNILGFLSSKQISLTSSMYTYTGQINPGLTLVNPNYLVEEFNLYLDKIAFFRDGVDTGSFIRLGRSAATFGTTGNYQGYSNEVDTDIIINTDTDINVMGSKITQVGTPTAVSDATPLELVTVYHSKDITGMADPDAEIIADLMVLAPPSTIGNVNEYIQGRFANVLCFNSGVRSLRKYTINASSTWVTM